VALNNYLLQTRRLLHDPAGQAYSTVDVTSYINLARRRVALQSQCIRVLLSGGTITSLSILSGGSGYAGAATVTITGAGQQAQATATIAGGAVTSITLVNGGWGYINGATVTVTGSGGGSNASFTGTIDNSASTVINQEVYKFSTLNILARVTPGVDMVAGILNIAAQWGQGSVYKPTLSRKTWDDFQAYYRINANQYVNFPSVWSLYKRGFGGSFYLFPLPGQVMSMDIDTFCSCVDLVDDATPEAIDPPWTDAVQYYAAYLCYSNSQRKDDADRMLLIYTQEMRLYGADVETPFTEEYYRDDI